MVDRKDALTVLRIVAAVTLAAYIAGEHLEFSKAPAKQFLSVKIGSSSSGPIMSSPLNPMTFAEVEALTPQRPPGIRQNMDPEQEERRVPSTCHRVCGEERHP
jgi:hypothetical protein